MITDIAQGNIKPKFETPSGVHSELPFNITESTPGLHAGSTISQNTNHTLYIKELRPHVTLKKLNKIFEKYKGF